jgi:PAT family beta-lactamase induction signal transducer AmpG
MSTDKVEKVYSPPAPAGSSKRIPHPVAWVTTSYLAEGIPFAMVIWVTGTMLKNLGHSDSEITLLTSSVGIAWSLKPLWASFLDMYRTKKFWVLSMQLLMALLLGGIALALPLPSYVRVIYALLWALAFASATQDICVDGVYITSLDKKRQAQWIGVQGVFWVLGRIFATSLVVGIAGWLIGKGRDPKTAWMYSLGVSAGVMAFLAVYHYFILPTGSITERPRNAAAVMTTFVDTLKAFFQKKALWGMLLFVFLYRTGEGFLLVEAPLFMQAPLKDGGLGLSLDEKALIDGTISTSVSLVAGLLGGFVISKWGLKRSLLVLALCMNIPHLCYVYLSQAVRPDAPLSFLTVCTLVSIEKFGYSFGFVGNMLYMMQQIAPGKYKMAHYAFCTALMNLVLVPTQMASGPLADWMGYKRFFLFVLVASVPSILAAWRAPFPNPADAEGEEGDEKAPAAGEKAPTESSAAA